MLETILNNFHLEKILWGYWEEWREALMHI